MNIKALENRYRNLTYIPKIGAVLMMMAGLLMLSLLVLPVSQASPGNLPLIAPSPRPPLSDGDSGNDHGRASSAILGTITDLSRQQPGAAIEVTVNGARVRTDTDGRYSITGLNAGNYTVSLELYGQGEPAQGPVHVTLDGSYNAVINLEYYSQPAPTDTPQPTATVPAVSPATTPADLPDSGAPIGHRSLGIIFLGLLLLIMGITLFTKSRGNPVHKNSMQIGSDSQ